VQNIDEKFNPLSRAHERHGRRQTDRWQTDGWCHNTNVT